MLKLDSIASIAEITPFYGDLDDVFRLMKRLNRNTNKMWDSIWIVLSKFIHRKLAATEWRNRKWVVRDHLKNPLILTLFVHKYISVSKEEDYESLIELIENLKNQKMVWMCLKLSLSKDKNTLMALSNYRKYMRQTENNNLELYNKLIQTAINREIDLSRFYSYVFINEISGLKDVQYIRFIVFPWNKEKNSDSMIKAWKKFTKSKKFAYFSVRLIWDGMPLKEFLKIYKVLVSQNVRIEIVSHLNLNNLSLFLKEFSWWHCNSFFKIGGINEYILWYTTQDTSKIYLKEWYCKPDESSKYFIKITDWIIEHKNENLINDSGEIEIKLENLASIDFKFEKIFGKKKIDKI